MPAQLSKPSDILAFHAEIGVDIALEETPQNRFEENAGEASISSHSGLAPVGAPRNDTRREAPRVPLSAAASAAPVPPDAAALAAREMASKADTLEALHEILKSFDGCALKKTAKNLVFADGNPEARVMLVGEAPGADEDREGLPFVGRSGKLLDLMLGTIGLDRSSAYITNIVPWRPPGNRTPTPQETSICLPFIRRQIELANPDFLICLGKPSMQTLLGINDGIKAARGRWRDYDTGTRTIQAMATFHPAYLLRSPNEKKFAWRDMLALKKALAGREDGGKHRPELPRG
jgi:uracil-DNA glycosylase family 4